MATMKTTPPHAVALAACAYALSASGEIQLLPAGEFSAVDGRPYDAPFWLVNADIAAALIADLTARVNPLVIDYEHQTLLAAENGQPAPAAGWFKSLRWVEGIGLFATVEWTERAITHIDAGEYKFISPVIAYDKATGAIKKLINAALTNNPAIDGMAEVVARLTLELNPQENLSMDIEELLESLRWMLNLPRLATKEDIAAELQKAISLIKQGDGEAIAANTLGIVGLTQARATDIAALNARLVESSTALTAATAEIAAIKTEAHAHEVEELIFAALSDHKIAPAQKDAMVELGNSNIALLRSIIDAAVPVVAKGEAAPSGAAHAVDYSNDPVALSIAAQAYQAEELVAGRTLSIAEAVQHIFNQNK